jgi:hypothetical protein
LAADEFPKTIVANVVMETKCIGRPAVVEIAEVLLTFCGMREQSKVWTGLLGFGRFGSGHLAFSLGLANADPSTVYTTGV